MFASLLNLLGNFSYWLQSPVFLAIAVFQLWMFIHAIRNGEWLWALFIFIGYGIAALWYFFAVYRESTSTGFELPGAQSRARVRELQAKIHHLDNAYHHFQLGDVYFQRGRYADAEKRSECAST